MKRRIKLWLRKRALMLLSAIVWRLDDWVHRQQVKLREDLCGRKPVGEVAAPIPAKPAIARTCLTSDTGRPQGENFLQWEARKSGVAVISKKEARRRRERPSAASFDRRFA